MSTWLPERGVLPYRPRLGAPPLNRLTLQEPPFPWIVVPLLGAGFLVFFAGLALMGKAWHTWELGLLALGVALVGAGVALVAAFFRRVL